MFVLQQQHKLGRRFGNSKMHLSPPVALAVVRSKAVGLLLLIVTPSVEFCNCSMFCCALLCVHSSFAIISIGKTELVALLCLSSWCLVIVVWLFLTMPQGCLQFVIVVFLIILTLYYFCYVNHLQAQQKFKATKLCQQLFIWYKALCLQVGLCHLL